MKEHNWGPPLIEKVFTPPEKKFTPDKILSTWQQLSTEQLAHAMHEVNLNLTPMATEAILRGELGRLLLLNAYHERFYNLPFSFLRKKGLIDQRLSVNELGPSFFIHYAVLGEDSPTSVRGVENKPHIVAAARLSIQALAKAGLLPGGYEVIQGDHNSELPRAKVSLLSLVSQYGAAEAGTIEWLMKNGEIGINGDVHHTYTPTSDEELQSGLLAIKSLTQPSIHTGIAWRLKGQPTKTAFGDIYDAQIVLNKNVFGPGKNSVHIPVADDTYEGRIVVYRERDGSLAFQSWVLEPTAQATEDEISEIWSIWRTHSDIYRGMTKISGGQETWNSAAALAIPAYTSEHNLYTAMMLTTANNVGLSGTIPLAIILKNAQEAAKLHQHGLLTQVGPGKKFETLELLLQRTLFWMQSENGLDKKFLFTNPHLITTITTDDKEIFRKLTE